MKVWVVSSWDDTLGMMVTVYAEDKWKEAKNKYDAEIQRLKKRVSPGKEPQVFLSDHIVNE